LFEHVAARAFEVYDNDIGCQFIEAVEKIGRIVDVNDIAVTRFPQTISKHGGAKRVYIDNGDAKILIHARTSATSANPKTM
jgi:hypothetical protein